MKKMKHEDELRVTIINSSTSTEGNISCQTSIRFDGNHNGEIKAVNKVIIGEKAFIDGKITAAIIEIFGQVIGDCYAKESVTLSSSSNFKGNIYTNQIVVNEGAVFNGSIEMSTQLHDDNLSVKK